MGQRFQVAVYTKREQYGDHRDKEKATELIEVHLQWSWGHFSIIRAHQLLDFFAKDLKSQYPECRSRMYSKESLSSIVKSLSSLNILYGTCVTASDVLDRDNNTGKIPECVSPYIYDNNDGVFVLDLSEDIPKYAFLLLDSEYAYDWDILKTNASGYIEYGDYDLSRGVVDNEKEIILGMIDDINKYELISDEKLKVIYKDLFYGRDGKIITKIPDLN